MVYGIGFTFDDEDRRGTASSIDAMKRLIADNPHNQEAIFPFIGGEELNSSPTHAHRRYVINFGDLSETECRERWPDLMRIVEAKVKPERLKNNREIRRRYWWRFGETTPALRAAIAGLERVLVTPLTSTHIAFAFLPARMVFSHNLVVFSLTSEAAISVLQSRPHDVWVRFTSSTLEDRLGYRASDCFETFPFPADWTTRSDLEAIGKAYYGYRAQLMIDNDEGLTKTYNRFHDPNEQDPRIERLRELHAEMDRAVLDAYGWTDIPTECEFLLDYEIDEEEYANRKKPYRYRWPDDVHDEVLGRLLELNAQRAAEDAGSPNTKPTGRRSTTRSDSEPPQGGLFG
jgi:hypothetical protein